MFLYSMYYPDRKYCTSNTNNSNFSNAFQQKRGEPEIVLKPKLHLEGDDRALSHWLICEFHYCEEKGLIYTEPKWKLYTFIIQITNTIFNQCISLCPFTIGHITKTIICLKCIMHNREITHIVKTDSSSKPQLIVQTKCSFCCDLKETKNKRFIKTQCKS